MAYSARYNPDALPAHAEPDQAAQMIAQAQGGSKISPRPSPSIQSTSASTSYQNKPPPPLPGLPAQQHPYRPHNNSAASIVPQQQGRRASAGAPAKIPPSKSPSHSQSSAWPAPLKTNQRIPGEYPQSAGPQSNSHQQVPPAGYRPHSPLPPAGTADPTLWSLFQAVDVRRTGHLGEPELASALKNSDYSSFDPATVRMMIVLFDTNRSGTITYEEFCGLWGFLNAWRTLFDRFDEDRSGFISFAEYSKALVAFGYSLTHEFVSLMYRMYDRKGNESMSFDLFVQSCIQLKRMTDVFKRYDGDRDGYITLSFEEFLTEILQQQQGNGR